MHSFSVVRGRENSNCKWRKEGRTTEGERKRYYYCEQSTWFSFYLSKALCKLPKKLFCTFHLFPYNILFHTLILAASTSTTKKVADTRSKHAPKTTTTARTQPSNTAAGAKKSTPLSPVKNSSTAKSMVTHSSQRGRFTFHFINIIIYYFMGLK